MRCVIGNADYELTDAALSPWLHAALVCGAPSGLPQITAVWRP